MPSSEIALISLVFSAVCAEAVVEIEMAATRAAVIKMALILIDSSPCVLVS